MALSHSPSVITSGLVLYLDAANRRSYPGSGTTWFDLSGQGNHSTLVNGTSFNNNNGGRMAFNESSVSTPITTTYQNFTLLAWFINTTSSKTSRCIFSKNSFFATATNDWPVAIFLSDSGTTVSINITSGISFFITNPSEGSVISGSLGPVNSWNCVVATYNQSILNLFINGSLAASANNTISLPNNTGRVWTIGNSPLPRDGGATQTQYNGSMAIAQIYNRALSANEVSQNFNATRGRFGI